MACKECKPKNKADVINKNYAESMRNQAHDQSPYGEAEPSINATHK